MLLFLPLAAGFGSFPVNSQKTTGNLEADFRIGMVNPGDTPVRVQLSSWESKNYNVSFPRKSLRVESSEVTSNPSGSGWYYLGDGRYAEVEYLDFTVTASESRDSNDLEIPVTVRAASSESSGTAVSSNLVYIREHLFRLYVDRKIPEKESSDKDPTWVEVEDNSTSGSGNVQTNGSRASNNYKQGRESKDNGGADSTTLVLLVAVIAMAIYTYRVA